LKKWVVIAGGGSYGLGMFFVAGALSPAALLQGAVSAADGLRI
jgi:hypothetical protein